MEREVAEHPENERYCEIFGRYLPSTFIEISNPLAQNGIQIVPLGAGQDVGRSCILLTIGGKNVMLDCGMHMGYQDDRRFPDFS